MDRSERRFIVPIAMLDKVKTHDEDRKQQTGKELIIKA